MNTLKAIVEVCAKLSLDKLNRRPLLPGYSAAVTAVCLIHRICRDLVALETSKKWCQNRTTPSCIGLARVAAAAPFVAHYAV